MKELLKAVLEIEFREFYGEFNDAPARAKLNSHLEEILNIYRRRDFFYDSKIVCDESNNTPEVIDRHEMHVFIALGKKIGALDGTYTIEWNRYYGIAGPHGYMDFAAHPENEVDK